jgi:hypothetical protein
MDRKERDPAYRAIIYFAGIFAGIPKILLTYSYILKCIIPHRQSPSSQQVISGSPAKPQKPCGALLLPTVIVYSSLAKSMNIPAESWY